MQATNGSSAPFRSRNRLIGCVMAVMLVLSALAFASTARAEGTTQTYLALGGLGFILGDGGLTYGHETIWETYYNLHIWRGAYLGGDVQRIWNPGYNRDRGPATVFGLRLHIEDVVNFGSR